MDVNVHLDPGKRVINNLNGKVGTIVRPHHLARPAHHEICVHYDGSPPGLISIETRADIEYEGSEWYDAAMKCWHP